MIILTDEEVQALAHIPDYEVRQDLLDTYREVRLLELKRDEAIEGIAKREEFIAKLQALMAARTRNLQGGE